ncbi:hypothetical protein Efla_006518 [Eimeria flavescens]
MHGAYLQSLRLLAALPLDAKIEVAAFDLDDVVQRRFPTEASAGRRGNPGLGGNDASGAGTRPEGQGGPRADRMTGLVIRTPRGIQDCSQDLDPGEWQECSVRRGEHCSKARCKRLQYVVLHQGVQFIHDHMDPGPDEVQVAWEDGTVENVQCRDLQLVDRCLYVGDTVRDANSGALGLVLEVQQSLDVAIPVEAFKAAAAAAQSSEASAPQQQEQQDASPNLPPLPAAEQQLPPRLRGLRVRAMGAPTLSLEPPLLQQLQQFNEGLPVVCRGRMGCVISGKVDYVVVLDSGHEFTLEEGMVGVRPEPRRGHPMSWVSGLYPSLPVYATGELISHFQAQVERANAAAAAADAGRLCRGYVKSFAIRNIKVAWQLQGPLTAAGSHRVLAPWTEHEPSELLPLQQSIMRLGQPVYVDVRRVQQQEETSKSEAGAPGASQTTAAAAAFGSANYTVGVVDRLRTSCTILWETGALEADVGSHRLTPVAIDRTPLSPADCQLVPVLLPHMVVQRRRHKPSQAPPLERQEGASGCCPQQQTCKLPWWLHLHFGGLQVGGGSCVDPHLVVAGRNNEGARVFREVAFALGADEGSLQAEGRSSSSNNSALLEAAAARRRAQQQRAANSHRQAEPQVSTSHDSCPAGREVAEEGGESAPKRQLDRNAAYEAARISLPLLLRFMKESDVPRQLLDQPRDRLPLLRRGTSGGGSRRPRNSEGPLMEGSSQADTEEAGGGHPHDAQIDETSLLVHEAQALAAEIFSFEGGPSLDAVASFLHLVYSHGQWGGSGGEALTEKHLQQIFEAVALVVGDAGPETLMDPVSQREGSQGVELGIVVYVHRKEKKAFVAWIKDTQQFAARLREEHAAYFAAAAKNPYCVPPPIGQVMRSLGITEFASGKRHGGDGPDVWSLYKEAEGRSWWFCSELMLQTWKSMLDLTWEPYGALSVQPQHLFFPGDLAVVRPDRLPGAEGLPTAAGLADARVFVEVIGFCGGSLWGRTLDGVVAPFLASDLLPLIFRRLEDLLDDTTSSEEGSEYSHDASDIEDGDWEDEDSGSDSTNITSLSRQSELSRSSDSP